MAKHVLIISSSPRKNSNFHILAESFAEGAENAGNTKAQLRLFRGGWIALKKLSSKVLSLRTV